MALENEIKNVSCRLHIIESILNFILYFQIDELHIDAVANSFVFRVLIKTSPTSHQLSSYSVDLSFAGSGYFFNWPVNRSVQLTSSSVYKFFSLQVIQLTSYLVEKLFS